MKAALLDLATAWRDARALPRNVEDVLLRRAPRVRGGMKGRAEEIAANLEDSALCIQGPPGTGKTHLAATMIVALIKAGKRVGVTANSHATVVNLMIACCRQWGPGLRCLKVGADHVAELEAVEPKADLATSEAAESTNDVPLVGGTAWFFSRPGVAGTFDYLFVDEAGQFSLANLVATARAARNVVLVGDQLQLSQPTKGSHPGESGLSALEYLLDGQTTIRPERGIFLHVTRRLHPAVCRFVSDAIYDGRLHADDGNANRVVRVPPGATGRIRVDAGLVFVPVEHEGNVQASDEEVAVIRAIVGELLGREHTGRDGRVAGRITIGDILVVAPYNAQVRRLREALPHGAHAGSVDLFQGRQAPIVIVSMCASDGESSPRGIEFLFSRNRLNVAVSRAQSLAIVVGNPALARTRCANVEQMALVNTFCRIVDEGGGGGDPAGAPRG